MKLSETIKSERKKLGLSQRELAKKINVDNALISRIENGSIIQPNYLILLKLSIELKINIVDLLLLSNYEMEDIVLLQNIEQFQIMGGVTKEKKEKYIENGEVNFSKVINDYKLNKLDEYEAIGLFIEELGIADTIGIAFNYSLRSFNKIDNK